MADDLATGSQGETRSSSSGAPGSDQSFLPLTRGEQLELLRIARTALEDCVLSGSRRETEPVSERLTEQGAAFVTLRRHGELRGCMGSLVARQPLYLEIQRTVGLAALADPRFAPVAPVEVAETEIEISVLGPLEPLTDPLDFDIGVHGLVLVLGDLRGTLLPQVAVDRGWSKEEFLANVCRKAGVPDDAWSDAELFRFCAQVFK